MLSITNTVRGLFARSATPSRLRRTQRTAQSLLRLEELEGRTLLSGWAVGIGGTAADQGMSLVLDGADNSYVIGQFQGTVDFDPGPGVTSLASSGTNDIFIAKYSASGALVWARRAGGNVTDINVTEYGNGIALDGSGNVLVTGMFQGTADFGPFILTGAGSNDIFVAKLDANGNFLWARSAGASLQDNGIGVAADGNGNVYVTGAFSSTVDFDPGPSTFNLTSAGLVDSFIWKLDSDGNFLWAHRAGSTGYDYGTCMAWDGTDILVMGQFENTVDFGATSLTSAGDVDVFVTKLDASGNSLWARAMGGTNRDGTNGRGGCLAVDASGSVYTTGYFIGSADFDPGPGSATLSNPANLADRASFVSKLDAAGNFVWAKGVTATLQTQGTGIALDASGNVYTIGRISGTVDFDPNAGTAYATASGSTSNVYLWKLDATGNFVSVRRMGIGPTGWQSDLAGGLAIDSSGAMRSTQAFLGTSVAFDTGTDFVSLTQTGPNGSAFDIFIANTTQNVPTMPQLTGLIDSPDPVSNKGTGVLTLAANDIRVVAGGSNVATVSFYRDKNGNGVLDVGTDTLLGTDSNGSNGWSLAVPIPKNFATGTYTYFAQAKDSANVAGNVVATTNTVSKTGAIAAMVASRDRTTASVDLVMDRYYSDDRKDGDESASPLHLSRRILAELLRTRGHR